MLQSPLTDVLVVDDTSTIRQFLSVSLKRAGYSVRLACDGFDAQEKIREQVPNYVISDWRMPNMNGAELCQWLRSQDLPRYVYFIMVTAHEDVFGLVNGLDSGADDYVKKPVIMNELLARLRCGQRILNLERRLKTLAGEQATAFMEELT